MRRHCRYSCAPKDEARHSYAGRGRPELAIELNNLGELNRAWSGE
jgi:hypothetical protein